MRLVVLGVSESVACALPSCLAAGVELAGVIFSPPEEPYFDAVRGWLCAEGVFHATPIGLDDDALRARVARELAPDLMVAAGFNTRVPASWLSIPTLGAVNLHPSLLPRLRGPCPQFWALARGEARTGVTAHYMTERFDDGPIVAAEPVTIDADDTLGSLKAKLEEAEGNLFLQVIRAFASRGRLPGLTQNETVATWAPMVRDLDLTIDCGTEAAGALRLVRAANPHYGARATVAGRRALIFQARASAVERGAARAGECTVEDGVPTLWCADGGIVPEVLHVEGLGLMDHWRLGSVLAEKGLKAAA